MLTKRTGRMGTLILLIPTAIAVFYFIYGNSTSGKSEFYNPIMPMGADPWVILHTDGYYYMTRTTGSNITIWKAKTLTGIAGGEMRVVWTPPASGPNSKNIWAPELHWLDGRWYIYYAADDGHNPNHRMFVLESVGSDALGPYADKGQITDSTNKWAIDGTVLTKDDGSRYFLWSGWEGDVNVRQNLYIAPMSNPYTISGPRVEISRPDYYWERIGTPHVNEAPQVLIRNGTIYVMYSASGSWTDDYAIGMLTADMNSDVLAPSSWTKRDQPVFSKDNGVYGPGHHSFTTSPDGKEDWVVYHAARYSKAGWERNIRMQPFFWNEDGTPRLGNPVSIDTPLPVPSGEPARIRYEAENARLHNVSVEEHSSASGGNKVAFRGSGRDRHVEFVVNVKQSGMYLLTIRYGYDVNDGKPGMILVAVNNGDSLPAGLVGYPARNLWANASMKVELKKGNNTIRLERPTVQLDLDAIDISPWP